MIEAVLIEVLAIWKILSGFIANSPLFVAIVVILNAFAPALCSGFRPEGVSDEWDTDGDG